MPQLCNSVNAMRAFSEPVAVQVIGRPGEKTSHKSPPGRHCAGPSVGRGSADGVSGPTTGLVLWPMRSIPGRRAAAGRVVSDDDWVEARASRGNSGLPVLWRGTECPRRPWV
jgi:hypothetical protein